MKRVFDLVVAVPLLISLCMPMLVLAIIIKMTSPGPVLYWSYRVGKDNKIFRMCKFRTMRVDAPEIASHLLEDPNRYLTRVGSFLRKTSLDELPQLFNIARGDMTFVGPRPALYNQDDLIELRAKKSIHTLVPGVTGWAQINGRDELSISVKVEFDEYYLKHRSFLMDIRIIARTVRKVLAREGVTH